MKILIIGNTDFTTFDGVKRVALNFAKLAEHKGQYVYFVILESNNSSISTEISYELEKFKIIRISNKYRIDKRFIRFIKYLFGIDYSRFYKGLYKVLKNNERPDVILVLGYGLVPDAKKTLKKLGIKNIKVVSWIHRSIIHNDIASKIEDFLSKNRRPRVLKQADAHLAISTGMKEQILKFDPSAKVYTVFNPLGPYNGGLILRSKIPTFLYVGRIDDGQKNLSFMFNGLSKVKKDWKLIIVGTGPDEDKLKNLADSLGISQKIEWRGFVKKSPYENLDEGITALLLTSRFEGFGMVLAEANQRGIPVISSDCQVGPSDIVIPGVNGYLYPEGDMDAFVKIINDMIDGKLDFGTPEEIAKTAERFSGEAVCNNIINALKDITGKE